MLKPLLLLPNPILCEDSEGGYLASYMVFYGNNHWISGHSIWSVTEDSAKSLARNLAKLHADEDLGIRI